MVNTTWRPNSTWAGSPASQFLNDVFQTRRSRTGTGSGLSPALPTDDWQLILDGDAKMLRLEGAFPRRAARRGRATRPRPAPTDPDGFVAWFEALKETGPGQGDPLFPWLAEAGRAWTRCAGS